MLIVVRVGRRGIRGVMEDFGVTIQELARINSIPLDNVREGMLLKVDIASDVVHVVMPFESVESIAKAYHINPSDIREYNGIDKVFVGDRVYIPRMR